MPDNHNNDQVGRYQAKLAISGAILAASIVALQELKSRESSETLSLIIGGVSVFCVLHILIVALQLTNNDHQSWVKKIFNQRFEDAYYFIIINLAFLYIPVLLLSLSLFKNGLWIVLSVVIFVVIASVASRSPEKKTSEKETKQ